MNSFIAELSEDNSRINITSDTFWRCSVDGNFKLSKYSGNGNDTIYINIPFDINYADGTIAFSYGINSCEIDYIYVYAPNLCYISTKPSFANCYNDENEKIKTIFFNCEDDKQAFNVEINCLDGWSVAYNSDNVNYVTTENEIYIVYDDNGEDGEVIIEPTHCNDLNKIYIKIIKEKNDEQ